MFQIVFNSTSAAEMSQLPKLLQLEILSEFQVLPEEFENGRDAEKYGRLERDGQIYYRYRTTDYRLYFQKTAQGLEIHRVLHKNTIKDFLFRTKLPLGEDEALQTDPAFWELLDNAKK